MTKVNLEQIKITDVDQLIDDDNKYLLIVFGGKTIFPRYNQILYLNNKKIIKIGQSYEERISSYLNDNDDFRQSNSRKRIELLIGYGLDKKECYEISKEDLHKVLIDLKEMGYEELGYARL